MAEYIDKNATVGILEAMSRSTDCECIKKRLEKAAKRVSAIPASDVAPVGHGLWAPVNKIDPISGYRCSKCRCIVGFDLTPYCPGCGAKMDGGGDAEG
jgi:hypothetical protein|uniref:Uncharacterized protein n=1 Tax=Siphoviridae sp. ctLsx2 TaxID=2826254 RepID=A0A8S5QSV1_9CAUD|nr:MAG TPA: hypothetical protein [Siphoviridae sp. ctLsx2]